MWDGCVSFLLYCCIARRLREATIAVRSQGAAYPEIGKPFPGRRPYLSYDVYLRVEESQPWIWDGYVGRPTIEVVTPSLARSLRYDVYLRVETQLWTWDENQA